MKIWNKQRIKLILDTKLTAVQFYSPVISLPQSIVIYLGMYLYNFEEKKKRSKELSINNT